MICNLSKLRTDSAGSFVCTLQVLHFAGHLSPGDLYSRRGKSTAKGALTSKWKFACVAIE